MTGPMTTDQLNNALMVAVKSGDLEEVKHLIRCGADIDTLIKYHCTPLFVAVWENHWDIVKYLVDKRANLETVDLFTGHTPLWMVAYNENVEMLQYFVSKGAKVDAQDFWGRTPLHVAAWKINLELVQMLVDLGASIDATDDDGLTPVHFAAKGTDEG